MEEDDVDAYVDDITRIALPCSFDNLFDSASDEELVLNSPAINVPPSPYASPGVNFSYEVSDACVDVSAVAIDALRSDQAVYVGELARAMDAYKP